MAVEGKNLDRGSSSSRRAVKILSGHPPVLKLYPGLQMFRPVQLVVLAAKSKTGFWFLDRES